MLFRSQTEAVCKIVGGMNYTYTLKGDGQLVTAPVPRQQQLEALNALIEVLNPSFLQLPDRIVAVIPPRPAGYEFNRELFKKKTGLGFDALSPAETAADLPLSFLFHPERLNRMAVNEVNGGLGLTEMINRLIAATWKSPLTVHPASWQVNYVSTPGNHVGAATFPIAATTAYRRGDGLHSASSFFLGRVEVEANAGVLVAFGDSITDGARSTLDTNNRWPDHLARRLAARKGPAVAVLNAGISGNRVLGDGAGISALARFDKDVLMQTGVTHVVVMEGINDIEIGRAHV